MFLQEECEYDGHETGLSPPDGQIHSALECEELCVLFQVFYYLKKKHNNVVLIQGICNYWVFNSATRSCQILDSSAKQCRGITGEPGLDNTFH